VIGYRHGRKEGERREHERANTDAREPEHARRERSAARMRRSDHFSDLTN
jgi:hypothetical protein